MLYPIELLRQMATAVNCAARGTASMLTAKAAFVMSSLGFLSVGQRWRGATGIGDRANCIIPKSHHCKMQ